MFVPVIRISLCPEQSSAVRVAFGLQYPFCYVPDSIGGVPPLAISNILSHGFLRRG